MKKLSIFCLIMLGVLISAYGEVKLDSLIWFDSVAFIDTNETFLVDKGGAFYIGRAYVNLRGDIAKDFFGSKITGRLTVDFTKLKYPIKYAYFDWKFIDALVLSGGLVKSFFGCIQDWEYPMPVGDIYDFDVKPTSSADFGLGLSGKFLPLEGLTKNLFEYYLQILNGEGYGNLYDASTSPANSAFAAQATLVIMPLNGLKIGGSYRTNPFQYDKSTPNLTNVSSDAYTAYISAKNIQIGEDIKIPVDFNFTYLAMTTKTITTSQTKEKNGYAYSVMLGYTLFDVFTPYVRYDFIEPDTDAAKTNDMNQVLYVSANIKADPKGNMTIKPLFAYYLMNKNKETKDIMLKLEFEYKLGFSIWQ